MGQLIKVESSTVIDDVLILDTDRSISGQDGEGFGSGADLPDTFPGRLATRLFEADGALEHVWIASNQVVIRRRGGWSGGASQEASDVVENFFLFYPDAQ